MAELLRLRKQPLEKKDKVVVWIENPETKETLTQPAFSSVTSATPLLKINSETYLNHVVKSMRLELLWTKMEEQEDLLTSILLLLMQYRKPSRNLEPKLMAEPLELTTLVVRKKVVAVATEEAEVAAEVAEVAMEVAAMAAAAMAEAEVEEAEEAMVVAEVAATVEAEVEEAEEVLVTSENNFFEDNQTNFSTFIQDKDLL